MQETKQVLRKTLDVKAAAEMIGVSTGTIYTMARQGELPCVRLRGMVLFHAERLEAWLRGDSSESQ